jgi:hypothetical protein
MVGQRVTIGLMLAFALSVCSWARAEETGTPNPLPVADTEPEANELAALKIIGVFARQQTPVILVERPEQVGESSVVRGESGNLEPTATGMLLLEGDTLLTGKRHQVYGRFGDGTAVYIGLASAVRIAERKADGRTVLEILQGALRVRVPPQGAEGAFLIRMPNVKEGSIEVALQKAHFNAYPTSYDAKSKKVKWELVVLSGEAQATYPVATPGAGNTSMKTVTIGTGMSVEMAFRWQPVQNPKVGGAVYELYLDTVTPPQRYEAFSAPPPIASPPPPISNGG